MREQDRWQEEHMEEQTCDQQAGMAQLVNRNKWEDYLEPETAGTVGSQVQLPLPVLCSLICYSP